MWWDEETSPYGVLIIYRMYRKHLLIRDTGIDAEVINKHRISYTYIYTQLNSTLSTTNAKNNAKNAPINKSITVKRV